MDILQQLLASDEPAIRYLAMTKLRGIELDSAEAIWARQAVRSSTLVRGLLSQRDAGGRIPGHPYAKFTGAHWALSMLAELGCPTGDESLLPLRDLVLAWLLSPGHTTEYVCTSKGSSYGKSGVPVIEGRARRCGSQEGNALWAILTLGMADERTDQLAANLIQWQWPDGGWNCDRNPAARTSSFHESILPLRALALHAKTTGCQESRAAASRASELFLSRRLFRGLRSGQVMHPEFVKIHFPRYWHYDFLMGLKVIEEAGMIHDPRCVDALDLLKSKRLPDGGFPLEGRYHRVLATPGSNVSLVDWGAPSKVRTNAFVTVDALTVLKASGSPIESESQ